MYYPGPHPTRADIAAFVLQTEQRQHCAPNSCFRIRSFICDKISQVSENIIHLYFNTLFFIQKRVSFRELLLLIFYCRVIFNNRAAPAVNSPSTFNTTMLLHSSSGGGKALVDKAGSPLESLGIYVHADTVVYTLAHAEAQILPWQTPSAETESGYGTDASFSHDYLRLKSHRD